MEEVSLTWVTCPFCQKKWSRPAVSVPENFIFLKIHALKDHPLEFIHKTVKENVSEEKALKFACPGASIQSQKAETDVPPVNEKRCAGGPAFLKMAGDSSVGLLQNDTLPSCPGPIQSDIISVDPLLIENDGPDIQEDLTLSPCLAVRVSLERLNSHEIKRLTMACGSTKSVKKTRLQERNCQPKKKKKRSGPLNGHLGLTCSICGFKLRRWEKTTLTSQLRRHVENRHADFAWECGLCSEPFKRKDAVIRHTKYKHAAGMKKKPLERIPRTKYAELVQEKIMECFGGQKKIRFCISKD